MNNLTFITGGARSGKSQLAETLAVKRGLPVSYLATMPRYDADREQTERINRHRQRRPACWQTIECSMQLSAAIERLAPGPSVAIIDCLSLEVTSLMLLNGGEQDPYSTEAIVESAMQNVLESIEKRTDIDFIVVTNETGWGIVPDNALARAFRDFLGMVNQRFATAAGRAYLMCSGISVLIKDSRSHLAVD